MRSRSEGNLLNYQGHVKQCNRARGAEMVHARGRCAAKLWEPHLTPRRGKPAALRHLMDNMNCGLPNFLHHAIHGEKQHTSVTDRLVLVLALNPKDKKAMVAEEDHS